MKELNELREKNLPESHQIQKLKSMKKVLEKNIETIQEKDSELDH